MQNLRVLYLKKAIGITRSCLWNMDHSVSAMNNKSDGTPWVALGEYDLIASYSVQCKSLFSYISEHNSALSSKREIGVFSRAICMLPYLTTEEAETKFWNDKRYWYLSVIRLHLISSPDTYDRKTTIAQELQRILRSHSLKFSMYQTVELGDIVITVYSNSLNKVLEITEEFNTIPDVAKTYTYNGMNLELLRTDSSTRPTSTIPFLSMSFMIRKTYGVRNALRVLNRSIGSCEKYAVTGTDDCLVIWNNISEHKLVDTFSSWVMRKKGSNYKMYDLLNMHTTPGIKTDLSSWQIASTSNQTPLTLCNKLSESLDRFQLDKPQWYKYFNRLISSLKFIATAPELDEFVFLFYPSVYAILENLIKVSDNEKENKKVSQYIQNWNYLMENLMQLEGYIVPEVHAQIFDIPPVFLEYIQAFLGQCVKLLHESGLKDNVEFLLTPKMCDRIEAFELFNIFEYETGLVLIDIPFSMFQDLKTMQIALCHEVSHYVGDKYRQRKERSQKFIVASAVLIARNLFGSFNEGLIYTLIDYFKKELDGVLTSRFQNISSIRLEDIVIVIGNSLYKLFNNADEYAQFLKSVFQNSHYANDDKIFPIVDNLHASVIIKHQIVPLLNDMYHLFRECFADLCAIYLLDLNAAEYYSSFETQIKAIGKEKMERLAIRLAASLAASKRNLSNIVPQNAELFGVMQKYYRECLTPPVDEPSNQVIPVASIITLYEYLCLCYELLKDVNTADLKRFLVDERTGSGENWNSFYSLIDKYRSDLLK